MPVRYRSTGVGVVRIHRMCLRILARDFVRKRPFMTTAAKSQFGTC